MELLLNQIVQQSEDNKKRLEDQPPKDSGETLETRLTTQEEEMPVKPKFVFDEGSDEKVGIINPQNLKEKGTMFRKKHL